MTEPVKRACPEIALAGSGRQGDQIGAAELSGVVVNRLGRNGLWCGWAIGRQC
jgi:hypothetical protein